MNINEIKIFTSHVNGWLTDREGELLYHLAEKCTGRGVIVEIGSWQGKSTIWLGLGSKSGKGIKVYAIDPHTGAPENGEDYGKIWTYDQFKKNITDAKIDDLIEPMVMTSEKAANNFDVPVELIFIDGVHQYDFVKLDFELWFPKLIDGGTMVFHDTTSYEGPKRVVEEFVFNSRNFRNAGFVDSITFAEKIKNNSIKDRIHNKFILAIKNIYQWFGQIKLPKAMRQIMKFTGIKLIKIIQQFIL